MFVCVGLPYTAIIIIQLMINNLICNVFAGTDIPKSHDLLFSVVKPYASHWQALGLNLGLKVYHIVNISEDHKHDPNRIINCYRKMLTKISPMPTWDQLKCAIDDLIGKPLLPFTKKSKLCI